MMNFIVVSVYWPVIHPKTIEKHRVDGPYAKVLCQYCVHTIPAIVCLINTYLTNCVLIRNMLKPLTIIMVTYGTINFIGTKISGAPIYHFLHWESAETPILITVLIGVFNCVYLGLCFVDELIKAKLVTKMNEINIL